MARARIESVSMLLGSLIILLSMVASPAQALEIRIMERAQLKGSKITLGEVATFSDKTDPRTQELKRIIIAHAPPAGKRLVLDRAFLNYRLGARLQQSNLSLVLPKELKVERLAQEVRREDLQRIFLEHVRNNMEWQTDKVSFRDIRSPEVISLPQGRLTYRVRTLGRSTYVGNVSLLVTFFVDGVRQRSVRISGQVDVMQEVVVAKRNLNRHQEIQPEAVYLKLMNSARVPMHAFTRLSAVLSMQTQHPVRAGQVILPRMLKRAPVVKRGDHLVLVAESAYLKVATTAKALEDGYLGEPVRVVNTGSGKEVNARVLGPRQVAVDF